jgi:hypothetical protein
LSELNTPKVSRFWLVTPSNSWVMSSGITIRLFATATPSGAQDRLGGGGESDAPLSFITRWPTSVG